ncbi:head maturation protease, ClpP-related [Pseudomonas sp. NPDC096917]|uniref:head maturation protease, ClpP-related n=1 Tax=Pseudomonas sp. NPDC096917 TaxID=3364483 RepID=UPI00383BD7AA
MTIRSLPAAPAGRPCAGVSFDLMPQAMERWNADIQAAAEDDKNTISILDAIGFDPWSGEGVTAKRISAALRSMAGADVTVNVNSPGGDMFEGLAIYNILREYKGHVTIKVLGLAASAASIIAMAGDEIQVARSGFLMVHNGWTISAGNRHQFREVADMMEPFDAAMGDIYSARTGGDLKAMQKLMDAETWIGGSAAVEQGFADSLLESDSIKEGTKAQVGLIAARKLDLILAKQGMPRSERRSLIQEIKSGTPCAAGPGTQDAAENLANLAEPIAELERALARFSAAATN